MTTRRESGKKQQDFFSNMQTLFMGGGDDESGPASGGIVGQLKAAADDLRAASDMLRQSTQAQPSYGGPNGSRPTFNGDGTRRPVPHDYGGGMQGYAGYGSLRRTVAQEAAARYGSTGGAFARGNTYKPHYDANGEISYYDEIDPRGHFVGMHSKGNQEVQKAFSRQQRAQGIAQLGDTPSPFAINGANGTVHTPGVQASQHIVNSTIGKIPYVGGIIAGAVGAIIGAPDAVMNGIVNQRAKNAQYQSILGGTNWSTGVHNRWLENGFKLSQLYSGGLTGAMSTEAFHGVTALGYTGQARDQSLGLITSNYKNLGMGVSDSLKFIGLMAQSSSASFESLKTVLNEVGTAARNTGQNLELARTNLANLFNIATNATGGAGALQTSGVLSTYQTQLGRNFANVDFSGMIPGQNPGLTALQASSVGMNMSQFEMTQAAGGPQARSLQERAGDNLLAMSVAPTVGVVKPVISQLMQEHGGLKSISSSNDSWQAFVKNVMSDHRFINSGVNIMALKAQIKAYTGATMNDQQAVEWLLRQTTGVGASFKAGDKQQQAAMMHRDGGYHKLAYGTGSMQAYGMVQDHKNGTVSNDVFNRWLKNNNYQMRGNDLYAKSAVSDPILDRFKDKFANQGTHVVVQTAHGQKVVTGQYAFENLQDQIAKGTAKFVGGRYDGQSVKDVVGGGYGESNYQGKSTTHVTGTDSKHFSTVKEFQKKNADKINGNGGTVVIAPNPALAQLLNITATGNVTIANAGAQWGSVPKPNQVGVNLGS